MRNISWMKHVIILCVATGMLTGSVFAAEATKQPTLTEEDCSQEILLSYFPSIFVKETLKKFKVPENQWDAINKELNARDKEIIKIVESKAAKINPNPLKDPQQRQAAVKLFRETLMDNFASVLKAHGVSDDKQIQAMLDDIQQQKAKRFASCMQQQHQKMSGGKDMNDDDDDSDDEEYED